jgi:hypothetical protein
MDIWKELQISATTDKTEIRRAYAHRLKQVHPEDDPRGFQRLRDAYEAALQWSRFGFLLLEEDENEPDDSIPEKALAANPSDENPESLMFKTQPEDYTPSPDSCPDEANQEFVEFEIQTEDHAPFPDSSQNEAQRLMDDLVHTLEAEGESAALKRFEAIIKSPEIDNLEIRYIFNELLAEMLHKREKMPYELLARSAELLGMEEKLSEINSDFDYRHEYLVERLKTRRCYLKLLETARMSRSSINREFLNIRLVTRMDILAANILTGPFNPRLFRSVAFWPSKRDAIIRTLDQLKNHHPGVIQYELDPQIVKWWEGKKAAVDKRSRILRPIFIALGISVLLAVIGAPVIYTVVSTNNDPGASGSLSIYRGQPFSLLIMLFWLYNFLRRKSKDD